MAATVDFSQMQMRWSERVHALDLVVEPASNGRGRIAIDATAATALLLCLLCDRRADADDVLPPDLTPGLAGQDDGIFSRRGWIGDPLLSDGERLGSRWWLRARDNSTDVTRLLVEDDADEATAHLAAYHGVEITHSAAWERRPGGADICVVTTTAADTTLRTRATGL